MTRTQQESLLTIVLMAAFADGGRNDAERDRVQKLAASLGGDAAGIDVAGLARRVMLKEVSLDAPVAGLQDASLKEQAYEMALAVCDADGARNDAETRFLASLQTALGLNDETTQTLSANADKLAAAPVAVTSAIEPASMASTMNAAETDKMILNYAMLNGALELLPQGLASMAIIPLQMRMVYRIGKSHGYDLDSGHIKDFLATVGVGMTSQYVEKFGRKLIGGLLGKVAGGIGRGIGSAVTGSAFSFGTTYALGHVAKRYYAGGRTLSTDMLQRAYQDAMGEAGAMKDRYLPQMQAQAQTLDLSKVMEMVKR